MISEVARTLAAAQMISKTNQERFVTWDVSSEQGQFSDQEGVFQKKEKRTLIAYSSSGDISHVDLERTESYAESCGIKSVWFVRRLQDHSGTKGLGAFFYNPPFRTRSGFFLCGNDDSRVALAVSQCVLVDVVASDAASSQEIPCRVLIESSDITVFDSAPHLVQVKHASSLRVPSFRDLAFLAETMSCIPGSGMKFFFLGDLAELVEDGDSFCDYEKPELVYSPVGGFRISTGVGVSPPEVLLDLDEDRVDINYVSHWIAHVQKNVRFDSPLSRRSSVFFPVYLPELHVQATMGRASSDLEKLKQRMTVMNEEMSGVNIFSMPLDGQARLAHAYRAKLEFFDADFSAVMPIPVRQLFSDLDSPLHDSYSAACELIDFVVQFHSLIAASIGYKFTQGGSPLTRFFGENSYTDLRSWLLEFQVAKGEFDKQFALITLGKEPALHGKVEPWVLPYFSSFFAEEVGAALDLLRQIRNRNFAHSGSYSDAEKMSVVAEVKSVCLRYFEAAAPAWSVISVGTIAKSEGVCCWIKPLGAGSCEVEHLPFRIEPEDAREVGELVVGIRGSTLASVTSVFPAFYVLPAGTPDADHIYFLSSMERETQDRNPSYHFNCYTHAPWGERVFKSDAEEISRLLRNIKLMEKSEYKAQLVVAKDPSTGGFSFALVHSRSLYMLSEDELAGSLASYVNDKPLEVSADKMIPIPLDDIPLIVPREFVLMPGSSSILEILRPQYDVGKIARVGLASARYTKLSILIKLLAGNAQV